MIKINRTLWISLFFVPALILSGCAKKKVKEDGDVAAETVDMSATSLGSGQPIPELRAVYFAYDSFNIGGSSSAALATNAAWLKANASRLVQIEGHCDERGTTEYNLALGERRARAVRDFLISKGVSSSQLSTISYGEERPSVPGDSESAWSKNRRAEFVSAGR